MRNQSLRLFLYSSTALVVLTLVWGFRTIPKQAELARSAVKSSVEQEILSLTSAVQASTQALKYRLLDVLKAEGNDYPSRTFRQSPFVAVTLLEWSDTQWKMLWHSSKTKAQFQAQDFKNWMLEWPLSKIEPDQVHFVKVGDWQGQPYFAILAPVRRPSNIPMIGVGVFPANQFGLTITSDRIRDVHVFDDKGYAIALRDPAYLGTALKAEPAVETALSSGEVFVRHEFSDGKGRSLLAMAMRMPGSNLTASVQANLNPTTPFKLKSWLFLIFSAAAACALNWLLFIFLSRPVKIENEQLQRTIENLKRQLLERKPEEPVIQPTLPLDFVEPESQVGLPAPEALRQTSLQQVVTAALKSLDSRIKDSNIQVAEKGLQSVFIQGDILQLQTAIEEILKNAIESMQFSPERWLTITATQADGEVRVIIEDTGVGISNENIEKVFDPFFSTKDSEGVARGLGLNVARRVIEEMNGRVSLESHQSEKSSGTTVTMVWPQETAVSESVEEVSVSAAPAEQEPAKPGEAPVRGVDEMILESDDQQKDEITVDNSAEEARQLLFEETIAASKPVGAPEPVISDLDLLSEEYENESLKLWPTVPIRKPKVRSLD